MRKGEQTRQRILDIAEAAILQKGFGATSIDEVIAEAEITKSGFIYHFPDKNQLALALLARYLERDDVLLDDIEARAAALSDDPLQQLLIGLKLFAELLEDIPGGHPGCLVATVCYQERLFNAEVHALNQKAVLAWRTRFAAAFKAIMREYPPATPVDAEELADMVSTMVEGGLVMARAIGDPSILPQQLLHFRNYVKLLFQPRLSA